MFTLLFSIQMNTYNDHELVKLQKGHHNSTIIIIHMTCALYFESYNSFM